MAPFAGRCRLNSGEVMQHKSAWVCSVLSLALLAIAPAMAQVTSTPVPLQTGPNITPPPIPVPPVPLTASMRADLATAAQFGDTASQYKLGEMYFSGREVPENTAAAAVWFKKAADKDYAEAEFGLGEIYYADGASQDYTAAAEWFRKAADQGYGLAQNFLGGMYDKGQGVPQDAVQAYTWLDLATTATTGQIWGDGFTRERDALAGKMTADQITEARKRVAAWKPAPVTTNQQVTAGLAALNANNFPEALRILSPLATDGNRLAQLELGDMYRYGEGVVANDATTAVWYRKAADQGLAAAQALLGIMYADGVGVPRDYAAAASWTQKAADQGLALGQLNLGMLYMDGQGVAKDDAKAAYWLRKAADQGADAAQYLLGTFYISGRGLTKPDMVEAYKWLKLATQYTSYAKLGNAASATLSLVSRQMTADQIAQAEAQVTAWQPVFQVV